jgi:hypothetical protein
MDGAIALRPLKKCGSRMTIIAVIRAPESIREIIAWMDSKGWGPP